MSTGYPNCIFSSTAFSIIEFFNINILPKLNETHPQTFHTLTVLEVMYKAILIITIIPSGILLNSNIIFTTYYRDLYRND